MRTYGKKEGSLRISYIHIHVYIYIYEHIHIRTHRIYCLRLRGHGLRVLAL